MFEIPYAHGKTEAFWASQSMVPGEPVFVLIQDDSVGDKGSLCVTTMSLKWVREKIGQTLREEGATFDYVKLYALLPGASELSEYDIAVKETDGKQILHLTKVITMDHNISMWSCEL